ncbi:hypothetical protein [Plantactinospora endophytica]|uniref:SH3 domain-containing protein n=1 Tax=Plantactinospora endophytica TaxID=673535 RepID=A0ABQ4DXA1_9ACTN|nr:hypothetical protein [Plantactinospora endophytica]GIG87087.1 hypothetical protein Pen02_20230 [Plantactinospora endophytica]
MSRGKTTRLVATVSGVALTGAVLAALPATGASASGGCSGSLITINSGSGAEAPSRAYGHRHATGNHYIRYRVGRYIGWYADNNGGWDGDTRDTFYTETYCG